MLVTTGPAQARSVGACCRIREGYLTGKQEGVNGEKNKATAAKESADLSVRVPLLPPATSCLRGSVRCVIAARERGQQAPHLTGENVPLESRMSMYTQLLEAAFAQRSPTCAGPTERSALEEVIRCRRELEKEVAPRSEGDSVPFTLALQISYDVAPFGAGPGSRRRDGPEPLRTASSRARASGACLSRPRDRSGDERCRGSRASPLLRVEEGLRCRWRRCGPRSPPAR